MSLPIPIANRTALHLLELSSFLTQQRCAQLFLNLVDALDLMLVTIMMRMLIIPQFQQVPALIVLSLLGLELVPFPRLLVLLLLVLSLEL